MELTQRSFCSIRSLNENLDCLKQLDSDVLCGWPRDYYFSINTKQQWNIICSSSILLANLFQIRTHESQIAKGNERKPSTTNRTLTKYKNERHFSLDFSLVISNFLLLGHACIQILEHLFSISILIRQSGSGKDES